MKTEEWVGTVTHYYPKAHAAAVRIDLGEIHKGDMIHIKAPDLDITTKVTSIQLDHEPRTEGRQGEEIGIAIDQPVPKNAHVFVVRG